MKALFFTEPGKMELRDIPIPTVNTDEYFVKIEACGICGSDFEGFLGKTGRRVAPMIMGHECAGIILHAPAGAHYQPGTKVAVFPKFYCGVCENCKKGQMNVCPTAKFLGVMDFNGAMTEYICVREEYLVPFDGAVSSRIAAMAEPFAVAYHAVSKIPPEQIAGADHIAVIGAGAIGLLVLQTLKFRGAKHVIVSDTSESRRLIAKQLGADDTVDPLDENFSSAIRRLTDGRMCDFTFEAVGISQTAQNALDALRIAGTSVWVGNAQKTVQIDMQQIVTTELTIKGNYIYTASDFRECVRLLAEGKINVEPLITDIMELSQGAEAFRRLKNNQDGRVIKIMLVNP